MPTAKKTRPKIELVFLWIESYRDNLENIGLNFSGDLQISYDADQATIEVHSKPTMGSPLPLTSFWGKNITNVTAIVGSNGAGKSSVLDCIRGLSPGKRLRDNTAFVAVYRIWNFEEDNPMAYLDFDATVKVFPGLNDRRPEVAKMDSEEISHQKSLSRQCNYIQPLSIFYSPSLDLRGLFQATRNSGQTDIDISTDSVVKESENIHFDRSALKTFRFKNNQMRLDLLADEKVGEFALDSFEDFLPEYFGLRLENTFDLDSPQKLTKNKALETASIYKLGKGLGALYQKLIGIPTNNQKWGNGVWAEIIQRRYRNLESQFRESRRNRNIDTFNPKDSRILFQHLLLYYSWKNIVANEVHFLVGNDTEGGLKWLDALEDLNINFVNWESSDEVFRFLQGTLSDFKFNGAHFWKQLMEAIFDSLDGAKIKFDGDLELIIPIDPTVEINKWYNQYIKVRPNEIVRYEPDEDIGFLNFSLRDLSTGEIALFDLFARLHHGLTRALKEKRRYEEYERANHFLLLIDEGEIGLHPKWQREYIKRILSFLNNLQSDIWDHLQVIFTTHSPLVLSDIPKENIIFLERENKKCVVKAHHENFFSFGANLHSILAQSFFLEKEGFMGAFAKEKISEGLRWLSLKAEILRKTDRLERMTGTALDKIKAREKTYIQGLKEELEQLPFSQMIEETRKQYLAYLCEIIDEPLIKFEFQALYESVFPSARVND